MKDVNKIKIKINQNKWEIGGLKMSDLIGFVISIALIYIGLKVTFKFIKWIGILMIVLCIFKMIAFIQASFLIGSLSRKVLFK